jgi:DNA primase
MAGKVDSTQYSANHIKSIIKGVGLDINGETGNDFLCFCPFHSNRHTSSFSVSKESGKFICFNPSCGESGTIIDLIKRMMDKNDYQALRFISAKEGELLNNFDETLNEVLSEKPAFEEFSQDTLDRLHADLAGSKNARGYLESRGINSDSMKHFGLGYSLSLIHI